MSFQIIWWTHFVVCTYDICQQVLRPQVQVQVQVPRPQVRVQVQVLRSQVQVQVQVLQTCTRVQLEYKYKYQVLHVCLSVYLSVRHTRDPRPNGSGYRNAFAPYDRAIFLVLQSKPRGRELGSPRTSVLNRDNPCRKRSWTQ